MTRESTWSNRARPPPRREASRYGRSDLQLNHLPPLRRTATRLPLLHLRNPPQTRYSCLQQLLIGAGRIDDVGRMQNLGRISNEVESTVVEIGPHRAQTKIAGTTNLKNVAEPQST